tara:strand:- start:7393 stop:8196 length:804 start_codon:yes stop_codon:yes gene_type:complete
LPYYKFDDISFHYEYYGKSKDCLLFIHGYTGDISDWQNQIEYFKNKYTVLALDLRGHGLTDSPKDRSKYTRVIMGDDVISLIEFLGLNKFHIVGHSMGGSIAQYIALKIPSKIRTLTLISSSFMIRQEKDPELSDWLQSRRQLAQEFGMTSVAQQAPLIPDDSMMPEHRIKYERYRLSRMSVDAFIGTSEGFKIQDRVDERVGDIKIPTMIICGELDSETMLKNSLNLSELITGSELDIIPSAQHSPQWEFPNLVNNILDKFLRKHQ